MLGSTLTVTLDGSGGTAKTLQLINQDGYSAEYYLDDGLKWYRAKVRHSKDNVKTGTQNFERHTVTFQAFVKPTAAIPLGSLCEVSFTVRRDPDLGVSGDEIDLSEAMSFYMVKAGGIAAKLFGWES